MILRKLLCLLALLAAVCFLGAAEALTVRQSFPSIHATMEVSDEYIILKPDNLSLHPEWLSAHETTEEALLADWDERGVLMQAWSTEGDVCIELSAVQDAYSTLYINSDDVEKADRTVYKNYFINTESKALGYSFPTSNKTPAWKVQGQPFSVMQFQYKRTWEGQSWRGYVRRTFKNGYNITLDYQVWGRNPKNADEAALNTIWKTVNFTSTNAAVDENGNPIVPKIITNLQFETKPPKETDTGTFTVKGTCTKDLRLVGVLMRMSDTQVVQVEDTASRSGKFSLPVTLPAEGVWLMTISVFSGDEIVEEAVFDTTTYQKGLLFVNLNQPLPTQLTGDTYVVSGTCLKQTKVQCIVDGVYTKAVTVNNSGGFSFKVPTDKEGVYNFSLVFEKKGYSTRRFTSTATRVFSEMDIRTKAVESAIKPAYTTLKKNLDGYTGRTMTYPLYLISSQESGDEWVLFMAMRKLKSGYADIVAVTCKEQPNFDPDTQHRMYGTLTGTYLVQDAENGDILYPCFDLIFWGD